LGTVDIHDRNWAAARESNVSAYLAQTSDYIALATRGCSAWRSEGDVSAAIRYFEHSIELNPADAGNIWFSGVVMYWAQQWKAAQNQALTVVEMLPGVAFGYALHALASSRLGDREAVYRHARQGESCAPGLTDLAMIARAYAQIGDHQESRRIFKSACAGVDAKNQDPEWQFWMHMSVEDYDRALSYLTRAIETNFPFNFVADVHFESAHPDFDPIRSYPEFDELVRRTALPLRNGAS
jgi:tetratricopeptide (TPR) repeat protein